MLPLLREQEGSGGQSQTSTAEERVIGAGLKALERHEDGAAVKELFYMFAVTQEDFVHPMAVIELLWRSCCALESEKQEGSLATRLKIRQWTQLLVDHSLLLGSSPRHALEATMSAYFEVMQATHDEKEYELQLVKAQDGMVRPRRWFDARQLDLEEYADHL